MKQAVPQGYGVHQYEVFIRGYRDNTKPGEGFRILVQYGNNPPPKWVTDSLVTMHTGLADRPVTAEARNGRPSGYLFVTMQPPPYADEKEPWFALIRMKTIAGDSSGTREGYEITALFIEKSSLDLSDKKWLQRYASLWSSIDWDYITVNRKNAYAIEEREISVDSKALLGRVEYGHSDCIAKVIVQKGAPIPVAELLWSNLQDAVNREHNVVIGLDAPLDVLQTLRCDGHPVSSFPWLWFKVEEPPAKRFSEKVREAIPEPHLATMAYTRLAEGFTIFEDLKSAQNDGSKRALEAREKQFAEAIEKINGAIQLCKMFGLPTDAACALRNECLEYRERDAQIKKTRYDDDSWIPNWDYEKLAMWAVAILLAILVLGAGYLLATDEFFGGHATPSKKGAAGETKKPPATQADQRSPHSSVAAPGPAVDEPDDSGKQSDTDTGTTQ